LAFPLGGDTFFAAVFFELTALAFFRGIPWPGF
jgi:hypothetical protein